MSLIKKIFAHLCVILGGIFLVFSIINTMNDAMNFINNDISLTLLLIWSVISMVTGGLFIADMFKAQHASDAPEKPTRDKRRNKRDVEDDFDSELESLINVETRHTRASVQARDEQDDEELDLFTSARHEKSAVSQRRTVAKNEEKLTGAARYKRNN